ncbi:MAG: dephospho-CoA kinase [Caulobacter sp.]|nr:dephospho-CoA kinase [Caulobacter sp.]
MLVGLTGSIGMGKSTTAQMFADEGVPVYDADAAVHALYAQGGAAVAPLQAAFGEDVVVDGAVDRNRLGARVLNDPWAMKQLEAIVHPLVGASRTGFFETARAAAAPIVILDIPLLFETGGEKAVQAVVVVSAPADLQRQRVLARPGMTPEKFEAIFARQLPDAEKRARADFVIDTGQGLESARDQVRKVLATLRRRLDARAEQGDGSVDGATHRS